MRRMSIIGSLSDLDLMTAKSLIKQHAEALLNDRNQVLLEWGLGQSG